MSDLTIPQRFYPGQVISGQYIDDNFSAVLKRINSNTLDQDSFRRLAGIGNDRKTAPYAYHPIAFGIPQVRLTDNETKTFLVWGYPYYRQGFWDTGLAPDDDASEGTLGNDNMLAGNYPIQIKNLQGCYHSATVGGAPGLHANDTITLTLSACRKNFVDASGGPSALNIKNDGTIQSSDITGWDDVVYAVALVQIFAANVAAGQRIVNNITGAICVKMAHVP